MMDICIRAIELPSTYRDYSFNKKKEVVKNRWTFAIKIGRRVVNSESWHQDRFNAVMAGERFIKDIIGNYDQKKVEIETWDLNSD